MDIETLIAFAKEMGRVVVACHDPEFAALDCGEAADSHERLRWTAEGALLTVIDGRWWQIGEIEDVYSGLEKLNE